jgi:hypothetical protein
MRAGKNPRGVFLDTKREVKYGKQKTGSGTSRHAVQRVQKAQLYNKQESQEHPGKTGVQEIVAP